MSSNKEQMNHNFHIIKTATFQAVVIIFFAAVVSLIVNFIRPDGIRFKTVPDNTVTNDIDGLKKINISELIKKSSDPDILILDARPNADFQTGHIKGAINYPYNTFDDWIEAFITSVATGTNIIVYCSGPHCTQATEVGEILMEMGYENIVHFPGGMEEWRANHLPVETEG